MRWAILMPVGATARGVGSGAVVAVLGAMGALACGSSGDGAPAYELRMPSPEADTPASEPDRQTTPEATAASATPSPTRTVAPTPTLDRDSHGRAHAGAHAPGGGALPEADAAHGGVRQP